MPCVCQNTPRRLRFGRLGSRSSTSRAMALLTPRNWWFLADHLDQRRPCTSSKTMKFSTKSSSRAGSQQAAHHASPGSTLPASSSSSMRFHSKKCSQRAGERAHLGVRAVGQQDEGVGVEELRDALAAVVAQVVVEGALQRHGAALQLDEHQRQAVDEADQVAAAAVHVAGHPDLRGEEEVVVGRRGPVDHAQGLDAVPAVLVGHLHLHAVLQQPVEVAVGVDGDLLGAVLRELLDGLCVGVGRQAGVQRLQRRAQAAGQDDLGFALAPLAAQLRRRSRRTGS